MNLWIASGECFLSSSNRLEHMSSNLPPIKHKTLIELITFLKQYLIDISKS